MIKDFDKLIDKIYEVDGLMLVLARHRENTPAEVVESLRSRIRQILEMTDSGQLQTAPFIPPLYISDDNDKDSETDDPDEDNAEECESEESHSTAESATQVDDAVEPAICLEESDIDNTSDIVEIDSIQEAVSVTTEHPEILIAADDVKLEKSEDKTDNNDIARYTDDEDSPDNYNGETATGSTDDNTEGSSDTPANPVPTGSISRIFTINDKFRFKRELFGNSDAQYVETMDVLSAMSSLDEAEEYLYEDLNWDPENEDVIAFTDIITNYFNNSHGR